MRSQLIMTVAIEALDSGLLDPAVHPLELAATQENSPPDCFLIFAAPWVVGLGPPVLDAVRLAVEPWSAIGLRAKARCQSASAGTEHLGMCRKSLFSANFL